MTIENVKEAINNNGYICYTEGQRPTLYDVNHKFICYVPIATADRMAKERDFVRWSESWGGYYVARRLGAKYTQHENNRHCQRIADELEEYCSGNVYRCPECNEIFTAPDGCEVYRCPDCGNLADLSEYEQQSIYDFLEDCLDIEYRISSRHELRSVQIMVTCGGPNIYIDTGSNKVELYWWGDRASYPISSDAAEELDAWAEELFNC